MTDQIADGPLAEPSIPVAPLTETEQHALMKDVVSLPHAIAQSLTVVAPAMSGAFITYLAATKAGGATPLSFLLAMVACVFLGGVVGEFALKLPSAGSLYTYTTNGLGSLLGWVTGWAYSFGLLIASVGVLAGGGVFISLVAQDQGLPTLFQQWYFWSAIGLVLYFLLSFYDVRFSTRAELVFTALTAGALLLLAFIIIGKGGAHGNTLDAFSPGAAGVSFGLVVGGLAFGILSFTGFETAAVLAEETSNPRRNVPVAVLSAVVLGGIFYLTVTYATSIGYGVREATTEWPKSAGGLQPLAKQYASYLENWVLLAGGLAAIFCGLGIHNAVSRMMFAMGREGVLPRALGRTHPKHRTPHIAILSYLGLIVVAMLLIIFLTSSHTREALGGGTKGQLAAGFYTFSEGLTLGAPPIMFGYVLLSLAGIRAGLRGDEQGRMNLRHIVTSLVALVAAGAAVWSSLYYSFVEAAPGAGIPTPYKIVPWLCLAWVLIGAGIALYVRRNRPDAWSEMGAVFE
jgi:amino acid transporter